MDTLSGTTMTVKMITSTLFCALLLLAGCQNSVLKTVRKVTYPPDFNYISSEQIRSTMHSFAWYTSMLDNTLRDPEQVTRDQRLAAIDILRKMEKLSGELGTESLSSNHDIISYNIDGFRQRIIDARLGLQQDPPNYYLVGAVSAYCLSCHSLRQ